ncbi:hypothetical protein GCM10018980_16740 [Streptomyces capoamus]|uniref:Uncharacterized protein n=1 Tax=Streptomyces capoamus TaxID=68183 RepID=A0A919C1X5_9ACTN|nr:hypothetical protein [Streptomyces capoamus]GGW13587.1 hypothetical protein GCM10010501_17800 [Streptomyces libani subsp. rufus]GHG41518.1 hypothetical protein GCM10018980_16740 [Streptomyces capoamus]
MDHAGSKAWFEALRVLRERERQPRWGCVLSGDMQSHHQQAVEAAAWQGLAELADREMRAELSVYAVRPILWAGTALP